jgi:branched-chain amino acid transport system ATP-binding protein
MANPLLQIDEITAGYHGRPVLRDISLSVSEGSIVGIVGPNGHGKTTLLRCISGLVPLLSGKISFGDKIITGMEVEKIVNQGIIHIPQGDFIFPKMSVRDNLLMGAYLPAAHANIEQQLEQVHSLFPRLLERRNQNANSLSGGERRMLGIGRGLMCGGRILMIDEPSLGLAPILIEQIYDALTNLKREGRTILLVEENATRAIDLADEISLLDHGEFVWSGSAGDLEERQEIFETYLGG